MNQTSFHPQKILRTVSIGLHIKKDVTSSFEIVASAAAVLHRPAHRPDPIPYRQFRRENLPRVFVVRAAVPDTVLRYAVLPSGMTDTTR